MSRLAIIIWAVVAAVLVLGLFELKYEVQRLEERLRTVRADIQREREAVHVLQAEWSYLNRPERIAELAARHLDLRPIDPDQVRRLDELPPRPMPAAAGEPDPGGSSEPEMPSADGAAEVAKRPPAPKPSPDVRLPAAVRRTLASLRSAE